MGESGSKPSEKEPECDRCEDTGWVEVYWFTDPCPDCEMGKVRQRELDEEVPRG